MVTYVLILALFNLLVGYLAGVCLAAPWPRTRGWSSWRFRFSRTNRPQDVPTFFSGNPVEDSERTPPRQARPLPPPPLIAGIDELPQDWLDRLAAAGIVPRSFVEGVAHVVRLDVNHYREQLVEIEVSLRAIGPQMTQAAAHTLVDRLRAINQEWLAQQTTAAKLLGQNSGRHGEQEQAAAALEQVLLDQAAQIRAFCEQCNAWETLGAELVTTRPLVEQVLALLVQAHAVRDRILDLLAALMPAGREGVPWPASVEIDPVTGLPNRLGVARLLAAWWRDDPQRTRLLSLIWFDLDRFGRLNQRLGTVWADRTAAALGRLIYESLPREGGFEHLARVGGQAFLIILGDTGPHQALSLAERLRQMIEATTFEAERLEFDVTISAGVVEARPGESSPGLLERANSTVRHAKRAGRNRCALDEGHGPVMLDPPQFPVKGRVVPLVPEATDVPFATVESSPAADLPARDNEPQDTSSETGNAKTGAPLEGGPQPSSSPAHQADPPSPNPTAPPRT